MQQNYVVEQVCVGSTTNCLASYDQRFKGTSPSSVAKKVANRSARDNGFGIYYITVRNCTRGASVRDPQRYKVRVLRATKAMKEKAALSDLPFTPQRYARIEHKY